MQTTKDLQSCNLNASCGIVPPFPLGERNALLIRSVKSAFALLLTRVTELWQAERMKKEKMKHYQITEELFFMLARYHLLGQEDEREEIETLLQSKVDAMINRSLYSQYKTADNPAEQEKVRQEYLDRKGYFPSFRW